MLMLSTNRCFASAPREGAPSSRLLGLTPIAEVGFFIVRGQPLRLGPDARRTRYVALGAVPNKDDSWLPYLDAPVGNALMRDFETNTYVK